MTPELLKDLAPATFAALVIFAALRDLSTFTIPNWVSAALAAAFAPAALISHMAWPDVGWHVALGLGMLVVAAVMFALGWIGGGDAKLAAAAALWLGPNPTSIMQFVFVTGLAGGALALSLVALRSAWLRPFTAAGPAWTRRLATPGESAPYGVAIAIGALAAFAAHPLI
jgi:prepilin peptidase CpaA